MFTTLSWCLRPGSFHGRGLPARLMLAGGQIPKAQIMAYPLQSFARQTRMQAGLVRPGKIQENQQEGAEISENTMKQQENIKLREASTQQEFYGLPLKKMAPQNEQDLLFKLNQKFNSAKDLLNFFESNRDLIQKSADAFRIVFSKLVGFKYAPKEKMQKGQSNPKPPLDLLNEAQFKVVLSDYNRFVGQEAEKFRKFSTKAPFYDAFLPTFESLMLLHFGKGKNTQVPENVRMTFLKLMNDSIYLRTLTYSQLASLLQLNASPSLLKTSIKAITIFAHTLGDCISSYQTLEDTQPVPPLSKLTAKEIHQIVYGFGHLHLVPHTELLLKLEPYIIAKIKEFSGDQLNQLAMYFVRLQSGTEIFLKRLFVELSLVQQTASFKSQAELLNVLDPQIINRKGIKLDLTLEVRTIAKEMMKKLSQINPKFHLPMIVPKFLHYQIGQKAYYEMLAIEFVKHVETFSFKNKTRLLYWFALADIDAAYILKTSHKMCSAYTEAFLHRESVMELPKLGLFTDQQLKYIGDASRDISEIKDGMVTNISQEEGNAPEKVLEKYRDKIEYEETQAIIKMAWSYMVFSTSSKDKDHISENKVVWEKLSKLINEKLLSFPVSQEFQLKSIDQDHLNQLNCFMQLELNFGDSKLIKIPSRVHFQPYNYNKSTSHDQKDYSSFVTNVRSYMKAEGLLESGFFDHYRLFGAQNVSSENPRDPRVYVVFNQKHWYFEDTKSYNAFVRIRREHMRKMTGTVKVAEIDYYQFKDFQKKHKEEAGSNRDEEEKEALFTLGGEVAKGETDAYKAYVKWIISKAK